MERLGGGNVTEVVRIGNTVRRPAGPWTPAVHALLRHLHEVGFAGAPFPLGVDEQGREVLTFIPGVVPWPDQFELLEHANQLARVGRLIRGLHDAVAGFIPPAVARWRVVVPAEGDEIIAHHDLAPWNLVIGDAGWAFIDWDGAGPGSRLWDLAYAAHGFVPLSADRRWRHLDAAHRLRILVDAYGLDEEQRLTLVPMLARRAHAMHDLLVSEAAKGTQPWLRLWDAGHGDTWRADADFIAQRSNSWEHALLS